MNAKQYRPLWVEITFSSALLAIMVGILAAFVAAGHWPAAAVAGLLIALSLLDLVARVRASVRKEPRPASIFTTLLPLSKAQRIVAVTIPLSALVAFAVASKGWAVLVTGDPGLVGMVGWFVIVMRREGWSGNK